MARIKNILNHVDIEIAAKRRKCHHKAAHKIAKGTVCLVVFGERGDRRNYCPVCAKPMLEHARSHLASYEEQLGLAPTAT